MKRTSIVMALVLVLSLLTGCAGTAVVYSGDCACPTEAEKPVYENATQETAPEYVPEGGLKTGLSIVTKLSDSVSATAEEDGKASYDVTFVAVLVDDNGIIADCIIDSMGTTVAFDVHGSIVSDIDAAVATKNELGDAYNMKLYGGAKYEWYEQADALAQYAVGKTVAELREGAVNESGKAADADLASKATIHLGGYVGAIEAAVANAQFLGAQAGDELRLAVLAKLSSSTPPTDEKNGNAQLDCDVTALTMNGDVITSCYIDSLQAKVAFDMVGAITSDISSGIATKNELGEGYNMKLYGGAKYEWYEQAASFAAYVTGKTAADVAGIAIDAGTKPTDADLSSSVTIAIGGFQALIQKACAK